MFDYGNSLGNALILKTHYRQMIGELESACKHFTPGKSSFKMFKKETDSGNSLADWIEKKEASCYICNQYKATYERYVDTFFYLWKNDPEFRDKIKDGKGFCLPHAKDLCLAADKKLSDKEKVDFYGVLLPLLKVNLERLAEDVSWMVDKFDYRNKDADWKNSKDAIQRGMQKLKGGYPADLPKRSNK